MSEIRVRGQRLAGLFVWNKDGVKGLNGRLELAGRLIVEPGSSVIIVPRKSTVDNGPTHDLVLMPPQEDNGNGNATSKGGNDDTPF